MIKQIFRKDLSFVDAIFEAGYGINHQDRQTRPNHFNAIVRDWHPVVAKCFLERCELIEKSGGA